METTSSSLTNEQRQVLIQLAMWAGAEDVKRRLGMPSEWNQGSWFGRQVKDGSCKTTCCIAGKAALMAGATPVLIDGYGDDVRKAKSRKFLEDAAYDIDGERVWVPGRAEAEDVEGFAAERLGLDWTQANKLFHGDNDLDDVLTAIAGILGVPLDD